MNRKIRIFLVLILVLLVCESVFSQTNSFNANDIYHITNPSSNCEMIVNGSGKILARNTEESSYLLLLQDAKTNEATYYYKMGISENFVDKEYESENNEKIKSKEGSFHSVFYDKNGNEVGLSLDKVYGVSLVLNDYIAYNVYDENINENSLYVFNVKTKENKKMEHNFIYYFSKHIVLSSSSWDEKDTKKEIIVLDDDFNEKKRIDGYSVLDTMHADKLNLIRIGKNVDKNNRTLDNFLDGNFNMVLDNDVEVLNTNIDSNIITIRDKDIYYDYDLKNKKKVGESKPYSSYESKNNYDYKYSLYTATISNIKKSDKNITYVSPRIYKNKVIYQADLEFKEEGHRFPSRIFNEDLTKVIDFNTVDFIDEERGKIFANSGEVYDFDLNFIIKLGENVSPEYFNCNDKIFYVDMFDSNFEQREKFNLYDENFNILLKEIKYCDFFTFKNMIQVEDDVSTKIYDTNMNIVKDFKRNVKVFNHYDVSFYSFTDTNTKRMGIMDKNFNVIIDNLKSVSELKDNYFTYQNGFKYGLMDYSGKVLLSFSIFDTMTEDSNPNDYRKDLVPGFVW